MSDTPLRILPALDDENREFWTSGADGTLRVRRCADCGFWIHPPYPSCPRCLSTNVNADAVSGRGTVVSFTVNHQPWNPLDPDPYVVALIEFDEQPGLRLMSNIVGCPVDHVHIGQRVQVTFEQHGEIHLPLFGPLEAQR